MPRLTKLAPKYRHHRPSGQAVVTLDGRDIYLGPYRTTVSRQEYDRLIGEWLANGRKLPGQGNDLRVAELIAGYWRHAKLYYRKPDGTPTSEQHVIRMAMKPLKQMYGNSRAVDFGPLNLRVVRDKMIASGWVRKTINKQVDRIRRAFKWAASQQMIPAGVYDALCTLDGLRQGRSDASESEPVRPVPAEWVDATLPHLSPTVRTMIELQLITGMRPGEACSMRTCDIDTTGTLWTYRPGTHKTQHHGHERTIYIGPKAQDILRPLLKPDLTACIFSPADADAWTREQRRQRRKTPIGYGNGPGTNRKRKPKVQPGVCYDVSAYRRAIRRACDRADLWEKGGRVVGNDERIVPRWHPHQLRHTAATRLRKEYGLEAAQVILGHKTLSVTEIYAEKNVEAAQRIMQAVG